jgi:pyruvate/2-oxoglutarate/acetoin dehydrogenase E1 component
LPRLRMNQAIVHALTEEMRADPDVILLGEDVAEAGGVFKTSEGLLEEFGPLRVRDTPISEMGFLGAAVGAAASGLRPVVEIMLVELLGVALDQLVTEAAKFRYLSGGAYGCPLVVRASVGAGLGFGAQHSQTLEGWLLGTAGLKVAAASSPQTAYGLLKAAIRDDDPVVILEPRHSYGTRDEVELGEGGVVSLGSAEVVTEGGDVTIVTLGSTRRIALDASAVADWNADVIDLRSLVPWDRQTVLASVSKTSRLVTVEEGPEAGGWGASIAAYVGAELFGDLSSPVTRITSPPVPVPYGKELEDRFVPGPDYVRSQIDTLITSGRRPDPWWAEEVTS